MARTITTGGANLKAVVSVSMPWTAVAWIKLASTTGNDGIPIGLTNTAIDRYMLLRAEGGGWSLQTWNGTTFNSTAVGSLSTNFTHIAIVATSATSKSVYFNGSLGGTQTDNNDPGALTRFVHGLAGSDVNANIAESALWSVALSASELASLAKGFSPALIRPISRVESWALLGNASPEPGLRGVAMTLNSSPAKADHPRIIYPPQITTKTAAAAGERAHLIGGRLIHNSLLTRGLVA